MDPTEKVRVGCLTLLLRKDSVVCKRRLLSFLAFGPTPLHIKSSPPPPPHRSLIRTKKKEREREEEEECVRTEQEQTKENVERVFITVFCLLHSPLFLLPPEAV